MAEESEEVAVARDLVQLTLGLADRIRGHYRERVAEFGLAPGDANLLFALDAEHGQTMSELAERLRLDRSNFTNVVARLEARGLARREPDPADRRGRLVLLSDEGARRRSQLEQRITTDNPALAGLTQSDRQALRRLLRRNQAAGEPRYDGSRTASADAGTHVALSSDARPRHSARSGS